MAKKNNKYFSLIAIISFLFLLNSCGMWSNFTTYFNRYYKAQKAFADGEEEIKLNQKKPLFQFKEEKLPSKANSNFDDVIKFSSKILQFNQDTKYVNEAIYIIAKSYYYKGQFNKALRKFIELDGLNDQELWLSTKYWISKSEFQMRNFVLALEHLDEVKALAIENEDEEILFQAYITEISYYIYKEEFSKAVLKIEELLKQDLDDDVMAEVTYELGMLYVSLENYEKAVNAFELVEDGSPTFEIEFRTKLEYAKAIKNLDRQEEAIDILNELRDNSKYEKYWDIVDLEIAQIHLEEGDTELALEIFYSVDTGYSKNESSGIAAFMQGDIMEHIYMDFDSAKILYEKVAVKKAPSEYRLEARLKANVLKSRKDYSDKIFIAKKEYQYLIDTTLFVEDSIAYAGYITRRDSAQFLDNEQKKLNEGNNRTTTRGRTRGTAIAKNKLFEYEEDSLFTYEPKLPLISIDSMQSYIVRNQYELGNLYFTDLLVPDSAFFYYNEIVTHYPNTRYQANVLYAMGSYYLTVDNKPKADSLFRIVYESYKSFPIAKAAALRLGIDTKDLDSDPALKKYLIAEEFIDEEDYLEAIEQFHFIYQTYPESQYAPKALYSIGWIYENEFADFDGASQFYDSLKVRYPKTEYVREVNPRLTYYHQEMKAVRDSIARVEKAISDSIKADSLAQFNANFIADSTMFSDSTSITDSTFLSDSTSIIDSTFLSDSTSIIDSTSIEIDDTTKKILDEPIQKDEMNNEEIDESISDSAKAANLFKQAKELGNKGKK
ncbi:MAG: tetratricopeptide repeat protein [Melioribacteraceae bacterium]|nr:tetratricopeptide repeat protein [Melioribacteraceae bacterium]